MLQWQASEKACAPWSHRNKEIDGMKLVWLALGCACGWWCWQFSQSVKEGVLTMPACALGGLCAGSGRGGR